MRYRHLDHRNKPTGFAEPRRQPDDFLNHERKKRRFLELLKRFLKLLLVVAFLIAILYFGYRQYGQTPQLFSIKPTPNAFNENPVATTQVTETLVERIYASTPSPEPINVTWLETRVHELINAQRTKNGLNELRWNDALANAARKHSVDMATRNYIAHDSPEGHDLTWRYTQEGFVCLSTYGENINQEWTFDTTWYSTRVGATIEWKTQEQIAQNIVADWMNSEGHRKNILMPAFGTEGIGIAVTSEGKVYANEDFC